LVAALTLIVPALLLGLWVASGQGRRPAAAGTPRPTPAVAVSERVPAASVTARVDPEPPLVAVVEAKLQEDPAPAAVAVEESDGTDELGERRDAESDSPARESAAPAPPPPASRARPETTLREAVASDAPIADVNGEPRRLRIRTKSGETVIGRVYGFSDG